MVLHVRASRHQMAHRQRSCLDSLEGLWEVSPSIDRDDREACFDGNQLCYETDYLHLTLTFLANQPVYFLNLLNTYLTVYGSASLRCT